MGKFKDFCEVDLELTDVTVKKHLKRLSQMIAYINKPISEISTEDIRTFLKTVQKQY